MASAGGVECRSVRCGVDSFLNDLHVLGSVFRIILIPWALLSVERLANRTACREERSLLVTKLR